MNNVKKLVVSTLALAASACMAIVIPNGSGTPGGLTALTALDSTEGLYSLQALWLQMLSNSAIASVIMLGCVLAIIWIPEFPDTIQNNRIQAGWRLRRRTRSAR